MDYIDQTFWRMAFGFVVIIGLGLLGVYMLSSYQKNGSVLPLEAKPVSGLTR